MTILEKLKIIREEKKITRKYLATKLNVSPSLINEVESGRSRLSLDLFIELCQIYEINPLQIIKDDRNNYLILNDEDIKILNDFSKVIEKLKTQIKTNNVQINDNHGTININQNNKK